MADASRDANRVTAILGRSSVARTPVEIYANPTTNALFVEIQDISAGTQTNDVKVTLDGEAVDTELPAAVVLSDSLSNPTTPLVGACVLGWDSVNSQWERLKTDQTGTLLVSSYPKVYDGGSWHNLAGDADGVDINDISAGTQTNDVKITLDSEEVIVAPSTGFNGAPVTVGTTIVELTFTGTTDSIMIQSDPDNVGKVWVGGSNITNVGANAVAQLEAGDAISIDINDGSAAWYAISDTASQNVFKLATT